MDQIKIAAAIALLEQNLPLSRNQLSLPASLRQLHQSILRHYLENGRAPSAGELEYAGDTEQGLQRLAAANIIVLDQEAAITGAYPFVDEVREFRVITEHGAVNAMCAFDALAISSMFELPTRIVSRCRLSGCSIVIEQNDASLQVIEPKQAVFGAINWDARDSEQSCSASLCTEMMFIAGEDNAEAWHRENSASRELFTLDEAHAFISAVFMPLMQAGEPIDKSG